MISYLDRTYCSKRDCPNMECSRNQATIDQMHFTTTGLPLAITMFEECEFFKKDLTSKS